MRPNLEKTCSAFSARAVSANAVMDCPRIPAASSARLLIDELTRQFKRVYELSSCRSVAIYVAVCHMPEECVNSLAQPWGSQSWLQPPFRRLLGCDSSLSFATRSDSVV